MTMNYYDKAIGSLEHKPDVLRTKIFSKRVVAMLGIGGTFTYTVQTYRHPEEGDIIFLEETSEAGTTRHVIPPEIANVIARQRAALVTKARRRASQRVAEERKANGIEPGFMKKKGRAVRSAGDQSTSDR